MATLLDLETAVKKIFREAWNERTGREVPSDTSVTLGNDGTVISAAVLYADLADSTRMVDSEEKTFSAEIYKTFLLCAARLIREENGTVTAYDGDRIMAVFIGDRKENRAVRAAMKIHFACLHIIQPALEAQYPTKTFHVKHVVGVDVSELLVAKTGVRGANDLVWVGRAANYAAKLSSMPSRYATYVTGSVFSALDPELLASNGSSMWYSQVWPFNASRIYCSNFWWRVK